MQPAHAIPELDAKGLRDFGLLTGGIVAVLFGLLLPWLLDRPWPVWPWITAGVLAAWGLAAPLSMRPLYRGWMRLGLLVGTVMTPLILALLFFLVVTPVGLARRWLAGDPMPKHRDGSAETYRVPSNKRNPEDLNRPF
jgi:hypothetical protein